MLIFVGAAAGILLGVAIVYGRRAVHRHHIYRLDTGRLWRGLRDRERGRK